MGAKIFQPFALRPLNTVRFSPEKSGSLLYTRAYTQSDKQTHTHIYEDSVIPASQGKIGSSILLVNHGWKGA